MRIIYIAKHNSGGNDDEGAIAYALGQLGHEVICLQETVAHIGIDHWRGDLMLFHKWRHPEALVKTRMPKVFWWFDLVDFPEDNTLHHRCDARKNWMQAVTPLVDLGFLSDGDWVSLDKTGKLYHLCQGADERIAYPGEADDMWDSRPLLFTGIRNQAGSIRTSFVDWMETAYRDQFRHLSHGYHGRFLANIIAEAKICVAPDGPLTHSYWSNRVYLTLGFGGFLLHPYCEGIKEHYDGSELVLYESRRHLVELINTYLYAAPLRQRIAEAGHKRTLAQHLYRHRCAQLLTTCKERGLI